MTYFFCVDFIRNDDSDSNEEDNSAQKVENKHTNASDEYNFENYDNESNILDWQFVSYTVNSIDDFSAGDIHCNIGSVALFDKNGKDPFITKEEDEDSEKEDDIIKEDDNLLLVGHVEDDASILEIFGSYLVSYRS